MDREITRKKRRRAQSGKNRRPAGPRNFEHLTQEHIGRLFLLAFRIFEHAALEEWRIRGFNDLRLVHLPIIRELPVEGMRTTDIALRTGMTKQAVGQLAMELEELDYVVRLPDPTDGRAKLVRYASRGQTMAAIIPQVIMGAEARIKAAVGTGDFIIIRRALKQLLAKANRTDLDPA